MNKRLYYLKIYFLLFLIFGMLNNLSAQKGAVIGIVKDADKPLISASVKILETLSGTITNADGRYSLSLDPGNYILEVSYIGYQSMRKSITIIEDGSTMLNFTLSKDLLVDEVVVTGTRSKPRSIIKSPVPIDNFSSAVLGHQGNSDLTETLKNLVPSFAATPLTGDGSAFVRSTSLRGLPPDQLLVLVNSKRRHRSALIAHFGAAMNAGAHAVDIGHIPSIALKNVEVLRDGATAQYGSDAIAGVMNFILKDASEGVEVQTQVGKWYGSETDYKFAINFGLPLTKKGFINVSGEYTYNEELSRGIQHSDAIGVPGVMDPAMNWGRPKSKGLRSVWNLGLELSNNLDFYSYGNFSDTYGNYGFFYRAPEKSGILTPIPIDPNDPSKGNFSWGDEFPAGFTPRFEGFQTDLSTILGLKGELDNGLVYDISASYGANRLDYVLNNSISPSWGPYSQTTFNPGDLKQEDFNYKVDLSKSFGNIHLAAGIEMRKETYTMYVGDEQSWRAGPWTGVSLLINPETGSNYEEPQIGAVGFPGTTRASAGSFKSTSDAYYIDAEWDISKSALLNVAFRHENYKKFGTTNNLKIAARYSFTDWFILRGACSTGFRPPTAGMANVTATTSSFDGASGKQVTEATIRPTEPLAISLGGKALVPEEAFNLSMGIASKISQSISATLDFYSIDVDKRIIKSRNLPIEGNSSFSELAFYTNALDTRTQGLDFVFSWKKNRTNISFAYNYNTTEIVGQKQINGVYPVSETTIFNIENNLPKHRATASVYHSIGKLSSMIRTNYYGETFDERGSREKIGDEILLDIELSYPVNENLKFVLGANNVLDNYPDKVNSRLSQGMPYPRRTPIGYLGGMVYFRTVFNY